MRSILFISVLFPFVCMGQGLQDNATSLLLPGIVNVPPLMSINISQGTHADMQLDDFNDMQLGKIYPSYLHLNVKSNVPWSISVMTDTRYLSSSSAMGSKNLPVHLIALKPAAQNGYIHLSNTPQTLLYNENNKIENSYPVDLKIDSPMNYYGGSYSFSIVFTISAQ